MVKNNPVKATRCLYSILCFLNTQVCYFCYFKKNTYCILFSYTICLLLFYEEQDLVLSLTRSAVRRISFVLSLEHMMMKSVNDSSFISYE